jgi:glutamate-1-semialdehyde 2,1-aminomutase
MAKLTSRLAAGLAESARDAGVALQVNAFGSLLTPFFTTAPVRDYQSALAADTAAYGRFFRAMLEAGIYPPPSQFEAWFLSGAHTRKDVDATVKASRKAMKAVAAG